MIIKHANILYVRDISKLGGVECYVYEVVKKYRDLDIAVCCLSCDIKQEQRLTKYCRVYRLKKDDIIKCDVCIINYDTSQLDKIQAKAIYMVFHADYSHGAYQTFPVFDKRITGYISITKHIQQAMYKKFGIKSTVHYNPLTVEPPAKRLVLVSATRLSFVKGKDRMQKLADALTKANVNFIWYVFTNDTDEIKNQNVIFLKPRLDVRYWISKADYVVQLSDTEGLSYTINEALYYNVPVIVTPLPYLNEIGVEDNKNALILDFNCKNIDSIVERIEKPLKFKFEQLEDNYDKLFKASKSKYKEELERMVTVKVTQRFTDIKHNLTRNAGDEFMEELDRANQICNAGYGIIVKNEIIETAKKEEPKEKAVKEKVVKAKKETAKKNAKVK